MSNRRERPRRRLANTKTGSASGKRNEGRVDAREQMKLGDYRVTFDSAGAHIERAGRAERYLVVGVAASTGTAFVRHYWQLCVAMSRGDAGALEPFKVEP